MSRTAFGKEYDNRFKTWIAPIISNIAEHVNDLTEEEKQNILYSIIIDMLHQIDLTDAAVIGVLEFCKATIISLHEVNQP